MYQGNTAFSEIETRWMCKWYYSHEMFWTEAYNVLMHVYPEQYFEQYKDLFFQMLLIKTIYFGFYTLLNTIYFTMHFNNVLSFCKQRRYKFPK